MDTDTPAGWYETLKRRAAKGLVYTLCALTAMPSWAASTLIQYPPFTATDPPGNVFVMLDDSASMGNHSLPLPAGITIVGSAGATVTLQGEGADLAGNWALRSFVIDRDNDWKLRAPALNPLWYNPAILYRPWNKDGVAMPNASIGGAVAGTNQGAHTSRADPAQLTERDPRQAPSGSGYASVTAGAGRGLIGTEPSDPVNNLLLGRRVNLATPSVDFRYYKMPFDFGPAKVGATTPPGNGHASQAWTTHNDATSPLDLFSRPTTTIASTAASGCFGSLAQCQSGASPQPAIITQQWTRVNCAGVTETFTSDPGPLTCYRARCGTGAWSAWSATQPVLACPYTWTDCLGVARSSPTNPGPISCGWRRADCAGTLQNFGSNPGNLTCYRTRDCAGGGWSGWSTTNPGTLPVCYQRRNCSNVWQYFSGTNPGTLNCAWSRQDCFGAVQTFPTNPGNLTCYQRQDCGGTNQVFTTNPGNLSCGWNRQNCTGTNQTFGSNPGSLTCYQRNNCGGGMTGPQPTAISPASVTCTSAGELPITYNTTTFTRTASEIIRSASTFTRSPYGGSTQNASVRTRVETTTRTPIAPNTITPTQQVQNNETTVRTAAQSNLSSCPVGTSSMSCTVPSIPNVADPAHLTPARYYAYTGAGDKGDPANYRVVQIDRTRPSAFLFPVIDAATGQAVTTSSSLRTDCAANGKTHCTWQQEAQNFANWWLYYRNRLFAAQAVMADAMSNMTTSTQQQLRLGYGRINYFGGAVNPWRTVPLDTISSLPDIDGFSNPGALVRGVRPFTVGTPARAAFFDWLFSLSWVGATPNREAVDSMGRYFSWSDNRGPWGAVPGTNDTTGQLACRRNSAFLTTDGEWTNVTAGQPLIGATGPLAGPGTPQESDNIGGPTITGDGQNAGATFTYNPSSWQQYTGGTSQSGTLTDAAVYYFNRDLRPDLPNVVRPITEASRPNPAFWQSMSTYIVGYGLSASMDTPANRSAILAGTPINWPTVDLGSTVLSGGNRVNDNLRAALASRGDFYAASDTNSLKEAILSAFKEIVTQQGSAGGVAVTGAGITGTSKAYFPSYTTGKWTGTLRAYASADLEALASGNVVTPAWTATVPGHASRNVLTSTGKTTATGFSAGTLSAEQSTALTGAEYTPTEVVSYLRGDDSLELQPSGNNAGRKFRRRESLLGDFVNSTPLYMKAPDFGYGVMPTIGSSYASFVSTRRAGTAASVYIGGNAGMFHAFDAETGVERFAYVPRGVYGDLAKLTDVGYSHRYFVDGPVTGGDWHDGSGWRSVVVGTTGAGGASIFAIDVTNPASVNASNVLWDLTKADSDHVGHILSRGIVGRVKTAADTYKWVYITGNGYESNSNRAALLVIDLANGNLTSIPVGPTWNAGMGLAARNGMGGVTVSYDPKRNISKVYAGDRQGNLWRFDFTDGIPTAAKGFGGTTQPLFTAADGGGKRRPITTAPRLALHPRGGTYVVFATGKLYDEGDFANTDTQAMYGLWEREGLTAPISASDLATVSMSTGAGGERTFSLNGVDWSAKNGWQVQLSPGERVISDPSAELGALSIASFTPAAGGDSCNGGGTSYLYRFNYSSGQVTGTQVTGVIGAITPLVAIPGRTRLRSTMDLGNVIRGVPGSAIGSGGGESSVQCQLYSTSIQGRPNVIAQNCPGFAPLRVWRQPTR